MEYYDRQCFSYGHDVMYEHRKEQKKACTELLSFLELLQNPVDCSI